MSVPFPIYFHHAHVALSTGGGSTMRVQLGLLPTVHIRNATRYFKFNTK